MKVFADCRWPDKTGIGKVQASLIERLPANLELCKLSIAGSVAGARAPFAIARALRARDRNGVFWNPGFMPPACSPVPAVVTIHDLTHLHYYSRAHALYYHLVLRSMYRRARAVVCVSDYTRQEFLEWSRMEPDRVFTVHNGITVSDFAQGPTLGLTYPYILYPGNHRPYKNLERLIRAFANSRLPADGVHLVLTGTPQRELMDVGVTCNVAQRLHFTGVLGDAQLTALYRGARALAFVSLYEGFGLPILESMAASIPVLTSTVSAMPEVAGGAALLVDPTSMDAIVQGLNEICYDETLRRRLIALGTARVGQFDWDSTAEKTWRIVAEAAS